MTALRGINLGGWLVVERWMTPELFKGLHARDEWSLSSKEGEEGRARLLRHREQFVTEADIKAIALAGFTFVRIPIGYWLWSEEEGYLSDGHIVDRLLDWCLKHRLKAVISIHGAPGSQNGWDHSGRIGAIKWHDPKNIERTLMTVRTVVERYGQHHALLGVNLLNEPHQSLPLEVLGDYYAKAHEIVRNGARDGVRSIVSDSFRPREMQEELVSRGLQETVLDIHLYQVFDERYRDLTFDQHISIVQNDWRELLYECASRQDVMVGEWSAMLDAGIFAGMADQTRHGMIRHFYDVQQELFDRSVWAWSYWSYKTGGVSVWNWSEHSDLGLTSTTN